MKSLEISIQGDVGVVPVKSFPRGRKIKDATRTLVRGLSTGHAHQLTGGDVFKIGEDLFFEAGKTVRLMHPEHNALTFKKGKYKVLIAKETDHIAQVVQAVSD